MKIILFFVIHIATNRKRASEKSENDESVFKVDKKDAGENLFNVRSEDHICEMDLDCFFTNDLESFDSVLLDDISFRSNINNDDLKNLHYNRNSLNLENELSDNFLALMDEEYCNFLNSTENFSDGCAMSICSESVTNDDQSNNEVYGSGGSSIADKHKKVAMVKKSKLKNRMLSYKNLSASDLISLDHNYYFDFSIISDNLEQSNIKYLKWIANKFNPNEPDLNYYDKELLTIIFKLEKIF